uniref:Prenyltransferase/squalene oxidase n=1 Tax=Streptomyces iakyrus TaxID=68219 RepID=W0W863_9ACTN|nr:Prenyltransferase/squalene oxidase [Streptomyces iakyrus]
MRPPNSPHSAPLPWPSEVSPGQVRKATSALVAHVGSRVDPDGAIREECQSRVLESALALTLMTRIGMASPARDGVLAFLRAHLDTPREFDRVLATLAVGRAADRSPADDTDLIDKLTDALLGAAPEFISARRRRMLYAVLSVLGCPLPPGLVPAADEEAPTDPMHSWAAVQQAAVTLILASAAGVSNEATAAALNTLNATRPATTVWEGYVLLHLLSLHGLAGVPGQEATVRSGLETLLRHQRDDGGFPFVLEMQNWCTSTAAIAFAAAGAPPALLQTIAGKLAAHRVDDSLRSLSLSLSRGAALTGGWSIGPGVAQNDVDCTSCVLEFLQETDPVSYGGTVRRGVDALLAVQGTDGGFPTYVAGAPSEPCMTAGAVNGLGPHPATAPARGRAICFLADSQLPDGGFEPGWSRSRLHALFRARLAAASRHGTREGTRLGVPRRQPTARRRFRAGMEPQSPAHDVPRPSGRMHRRLARPPYGRYGRADRALRVRDAEPRRRLGDAARRPQRRDQHRLRADHAVLRGRGPAGRARHVLAARAPERGRRVRRPARHGRPSSVPVPLARPDRHLSAPRVRPRPLPSSAHGVSTPGSGVR